MKIMLIFICPKPRGPTELLKNAKKPLPNWSRISRKVTQIPKFGLQRENEKRKKIFSKRILPKGILSHCNISSLPVEITKLNFPNNPTERRATDRPLGATRIYETVFSGDTQPRHKISRCSVSGRRAVGHAVSSVNNLNLMIYLS